jgi:hypothetical protein
MCVCNVFVHMLMGISKRAYTDASIYISMWSCINLYMHVVLHALRTCGRSCLLTCLQGTAALILHLERFHGSPVCIYACMYGDMHACMYIQAYAYKQACMHVCMYVCKAGLPLVLALLKSFHGSTVCVCEWMCVCMAEVWLWFLTSWVHCMCVYMYVFVYMSGDESAFIEQEQFCPMRIYVYICTYDMFSFRGVATYMIQAIRINIHN